VGALKWTFERGGSIVRRVGFAMAWPRRVALFRASSGCLAEG